MTALTNTVDAPAESGSTTHEIARMVRLHCVNPSVFFGIPLLILAVAWLVSLAITGLIAAGSGEPVSFDNPGGRYSWAVLSPQWYLVVVGVQAVASTFPFALGFGSTRRGFWLGTATMFVVVAGFFAVLNAVLVQVEQATQGWFIGAHMFDALWFGVDGFAVDLYAAFVLQLFVLFVGAAVTTVYMRWRMRGMTVLGLGSVAVLLLVATVLTFSDAWATTFAWIGSLGVVGGFTIVLGLTALCAVAGYLVIRRATPR